MPDIAINPRDSVRTVRYRKAAMLLKKWAEDDPAYDQKVSDALELELAKDGKIGRAHV